MLCLGVKESSILNNIFTLLNLVVVTYVVVCGLFKVDFHNWNIPKDEVRTIFNLYIDTLKVYEHKVSCTGSPGQLVDRVHV